MAFSDFTGAMLKDVIPTPFLPYESVKLNLASVKLDNLEVNYLLTNIPSTLKKLDLNLDSNKVPNIGDILRN